MNLNDMRANAYQNAQKNQSEEKKVVKAFNPPKYSSVEQAEAENQKNQPKVYTFQTFNSFSEAKKTEEKSADTKPVDFKMPEFNQLEKNKKIVSGNQISKKNETDAVKKLDEFASHLKNGGLIKVPVEPEVEGRDSVYRRVAKFLLLIGETEAAKILPHLSEKQIEKIIPEIASIRSVSPEEATVILEEFHQLVEKEKASGGVETARDILTKAYGKTRAEQMLSKAMPVQSEKPFSYLNEEEKEKIFLLLKDENIGVQSLVLSHIEPQKAAGVINMMDAESKKAVVLRLAKMEPINPELIRRVDAAMKEKAMNITTDKAEVVDGRNALAQILKKMNSGKETEIINSLSMDDPDLGDDMRARLFTIDDVVNADDRFIQEKLREYKESDIAYLIAGENKDFQDKILYNISTARREEVLVQSDILKPMRRDDVEKITNLFLSYLRQAYENGELIIKNRNDDIFV